MATVTKVHGNEEQRLELEESGVFTWDLATNTIYADTAVARLFGFSVSEALAGLPIQRFLSRIHHADRPKVAQSIHHAIVTGEPYHEVYTVLGDSGQSDVVALGRCFRNSEGEPSQYAGIVFKATDHAAHGNSMVAHIAVAHKLAVEAGKTQVADALESILEGLPRGIPDGVTAH